MERHKGLGQLGLNNIKLLAKKDQNLHNSGNVNDTICESFPLVKRNPVPNSHLATHRTSSPLQLIDTDYTGPRTTQSVGGATILFIIHSQLLKVYNGVYN